MPSVQTLRPTETPGFFTPNQINVTRFDFTAAQILTLNSSPITILPGIPGYFYGIFLWAFYKNSGPVFATGAQNINLQYNSATPFTASFVAAVGLIDQTVGGRWQLPAPGQDISDANSASAIGGKGMRLTCASADPTGTGSSCTLLMSYFIVPNVSTNIGTNLQVF